MEGGLVVRALSFVCSQEGTDDALCAQRFEVTDPLKAFTEVSTKASSLSCSPPLSLR